MIGAVFINPVNYPKIVAKMAFAFMMAVLKIIGED